MRVIFPIASVALAAASAPDLAKEFAEWETTHSKKYETTAERRQRFQVWITNREFVNGHNAQEEMGLHTYRMKLNHLGDLSADEYRSKYRGYKRTHSLNVADAPIQQSVVALLDSPFPPSRFTYPPPLT